jgi:hypothetical protein
MADGGANGGAANPLINTNYTIHREGFIFQVHSKARLSLTIRRQKNY